jgi:peptidoglycan hydrolase-like protein with peptidoglycan-binding domain
MNRRAVLAAVAAAAVVAALLGWALGQRIKSPAEIAAATAPPEPSLITVPVELRELSSRVVIRGTVQSSEETAIQVSAAALGNAVVTRLPKIEGDELAEGEVAVEITGRPVIVLQGRLPAYRTMGPSMEGPDVRQLEEALVRLGYDVGAVDEVYSSETGSAVEALYTSVGYKANGRTRDEKAAIDAARDRVRQLERSLASAMGSGGGRVPESVRLQADLQVTQAQRALNDARNDPIVAEAEAALANAESAVASAEAAQADARRRLSEAEAGTHPDTGHPPTDQELAALRGAVAAADAALAEAVDAKDAATRALEVARVVRQRAIDDAEVNLRIAKASRNETFASYTSGGGVNGGDGGLSIQDLRADLADAREDLNELLATTGVSFPIEELTFVPTLPREVKTLNVELGSSAQGTVMTVTGASTVLESAVSNADRKLLAEGMDAVVEDDELGISVPATITFMADDPGGGELSNDRYAMRLTPTGDLPQEAFRQSLRVTIPISSTGGEVLAVPLAAVSAGGDGRARVEVERTRGETELVTVTTGLAADGYVEIKPVGAGLEAGDRVVVGRDLLLPSQSGDGENEEDVDSGLGSEGEA